MAKTTKGTRNKKTESNSFIARFNLDELLPQKYHLLAVILVIIILFLAFLNPLYFGGKTFESGDIIAGAAMYPYIQNHQGGFTLWNPFIFCGLPAYATGTAFAWFNIISVVFTAGRSIFASFFSVDYAKWGFYLIILAFTSYLLMKQLTKNTLVSLFTAISTSFSTGLIVFLYIGHVTKLTSIAWYPLIFLMLIRMKEKIRLIDFLILIITMQLYLEGFHVQIIYYTFFAVGVYFLYFFLRSIIKKQYELRNQILKSAGVFIIASVIALLIQSDSISQIYQYTPYSTRGGKSIVEKEATSNNPSSSDYYEYHTMWSFSPQEILTFIDPSYYGFGNSTYIGSLSQDQPVDVNTYFGQMEFVDVAMYMGVLIFFLGLFGIFTCWKDPFVRFLTLISGIALLVSFGKNFSVLFNLFFYYLPLFNKFRVPSMILVLLQLSFPVLAGYGLMKIISLRKEKDIKLIKTIKNISFLFTILFVLSLLLNSAISDWFISRVNEHASGIQQNQPQLSQQFTALSQYMSDMFTSDLLIAFGILTVAFWAAYSYINSKISMDILILIMIGLTIFDLFRIDARGEKYVNNPDINNLFKVPDYVTAIKRQNDKNPFRILNIKQDRSLGSIGNNSNYNAHFLLEDFYGYSGIKPRSYQDLIDVVGSPVNQTLWRMLNVEYIIADQNIPFPGLVPIFQNGKEIVYKNDEALPRAYFVNKVETKGDLTVLNEIKNNTFDPKKVAFVDHNQPQVDVPDSTTKVSITKYKDEEIQINANASGNNFLFLGNTYIPTGWKAYIDGNKTRIYKVDHGFMGIVVPIGNHKIEFKYAPISFYISEYLALSLSSIVLIGLIITVAFELYKKNKIKNLRVQA
ncbi:MAG: YfhO family protein [Ignavibacteriaceae bacterium]